MDGIPSRILAAVAQATQGVAGCAGALVTVHDMLTLTLVTRRGDRQGASPLEIPA